MKKFIVLFPFILIVISQQVNADTFSVIYHFEKPKIEIAENNYADIFVDGCFNFAGEGHPLLPYYASDLLLPQSHEITGVKVITATYSDEISGIVIRPASRQFPVSQKPAEGYKAVPNELIYQSTDPYPAMVISNINTGFLCGHSIGSFSLCPVIFYPKDQKVKILEYIELQITTSVTPGALKSADKFRNSGDIRFRISKIVENPEALEFYSYPSVKNEETDILLITKSNLLTAFDNYTAYKESVGYIVSTITTEEIYSQYSGIDNQEKIRNCITDYYINHNLGFVILGGDSDHSNASQNIVPHRGLFAIDDDDIPSDMYYCCLDGSWNNDGDNKWGEAGEYDLYAEVAIGRICADNVTEIQNSTHKLEMYQNNPVVADLEKALMLGEELNNNPQTWGGDYKDEVAYGSSNFGFTTAPISENFEISTLYDREGGWSKYDVFEKFNIDGVNLLNHLGHSSPTYNMKMDNYDVNTSNFTNNGVTRGFVIGYSQGCYNGSFDNRDWNYYYGDDCFAEKITTISTAMVASVANSRYGWYSPGNTNSSSQYADRQFYDAIFGEEITLIGFVNSDSKEDNAAFFNNGEYMRWTAYELNLFGDPSMDIWTESPQAITVSYPASINIGSSFVEFQTNSPFARIGLSQNGTLIGRAVTDIAGMASVEFFEPVSSPDLISVSLIAHNKTRHTGTMSIVTDIPFVLFESYELNDPNGNDMIDFGELVELGVGLKNVGSQLATGVTVTLSASGEYVSVVDDVEVFGDFAPGETIFIENAFSLFAGANIPDLYLFTVDVVAIGQSIWNSSFSMMAYAPSFIMGNYTISDPAGNNNSRLDPGEEATIIFSLENNGHCDAPGSEAELLTSSNYLTITNPACGLGVIGAGEIAEPSFTVTVDPDAPEGTIALLELAVTSGYYHDHSDYSAKIGLIVEDWESGNFNQYNWSTSGHEPWQLVSSNAFEGVYCAKSGDISNNQFSILMLNYHAMIDDTISFYVKVSTESNYDFLKFFIDSDIVGQWSGNSGWQKVSFPVSDGTHNFKWFYDKDEYTSSGSDCVWIDFIELPAAGQSGISAGMNRTVCAGDSFTTEGYAVNYSGVEWTSSGTGFFNDPYVLNSVYNPGAGDITTGQVDLTLSVSFSGNILSDEMTLFINPLPEVYLGPDQTVYYLDEIELNADNPGMVYLWSTGENTQTIMAGSGGNAGNIIFWTDVTDTDGCTGTDQVVISFVETVGLNETQNEEMISIYPNPNNGFIYLETNFENDARFDLKVLNYTGKLVLEQNGIIPLYGEPIGINLAHLTEGIYFLKIVTGHAEIIKKLVIRN
jgi:hypothetical protein